MRIKCKRMKNCWLSCKRLRAVYISQSHRRETADLATHIAHITMPLPKILEININWLLYSFRIKQTYQYFPTCLILASAKITRMSQKSSGIFGSCNFKYDPSIALIRVDSESIGVTFPSSNWLHCIQSDDINITISNISRRRSIFRMIL